MKTKQSDMLIILLSVSGQYDEYWWIPANAQAQSLTATEAAQHSQKHPAMVLLESIGVRVEQVTLPAKVKVSEVGLLLEEQLCQSIDDVLLLPYQRKGRHLKVAVIDKALAQNWQNRLQDQAIQVARWIPESEAFAHAWTDDDALLLYSEARQWLFIPQQEILFNNRWVDLLQVWLPATRSVQKISVSDLPDAAVLPWLASSLPQHINLWPQAWYSKLRFPQWLYMTPGLFRLATPWGLLLLTLIIATLIKPNASSPHQRIAQQYLQLMGEPLNITQAPRRIEQRLQQLETHQDWQQQRLTIWQNLQQQLQQLPHIRVTALNFTEQGVRIELAGVKQQDQVRLKTVDGQWRFTDALGVLEKAL